ncbi:MAG: 16S rRNA (cytidine(1402)-2'-O)-methyltransferase [Chloroflexi bacterium]|nr:16S rRNA (cytidine(1402)-2'-O)-methyltransferase [Chloroflexota bacterium]
MGTLFLVATPIGNLEDITLRALRTLGEAGCIAAEDTRQTRKLLERYQIRVPLISYHEHNKLARLKDVLARLGQGDVALVSDAGTPGLSDPGYELVHAALEAGHRVQAIPGASAPIAALVSSGLPTDAFVFLGYLPRRASERRSALQTLATERRTALAFEVPHRLVQALADMQAVLGAERKLAVARELTKLHEEIFRGTVAEARTRFETQPALGEITLVIGGATEARQWDEARVRLALTEQQRLGTPPSEAARRVAEASGWPRRQVYRLAMESK